MCPTSLDFKPEGSASCFKSGDTWCQVLVLDRFGSELSDRCLADIIDLPVPLAISIHVQAMDKSKAVAFVKKRIAWMDKEIIDEQMSAVKKGYDFQILPSELKYSKEEAEDLLDHLQNKNQRLYVYTGLVYTYAPTRRQLDDQVMQIVSTARRNSIEADALDYRQREGLNSVLPLGHNHVEVSRMMTTAPGGHTDALRHPGALARGRGLLRAEQAVLQPRAVQPQEAREPHGVRRGQARLGQVLLGQARDRETPSSPTPTTRSSSSTPPGSTRRWCRPTGASACASRPTPTRT